MKGGREAVWPLPKDVKEAIDYYPKLDRKRGRSRIRVATTPTSSSRTPTTARSTSQGALDGDAQKIVKRWAEYSRLGDLSPHDLRRTAITRALESELSYRQVQMMSKHKDPKTAMRYDHGRENLDQNAVNFLAYEDDE